MHIVIILPRWVGDLVMSTPMLRAVREHYGSSARITGVAKPMFAELLEGTPWLDRLVFYDRHSRDPGRRFRAVARQLRADRADIALIVPNSLSSAALAWAGGARRRVGFARHGRRWLLTDPLEGPAGAIEDRRPVPVVTSQLVSRRARIASRSRHGHGRANRRAAAAAHPGVGHHAGR
jgi:heptosyltransferase II